MLVKLLIRWAIVAASLVVAVLLVPGITIEGNSAWFAVAVMAVILGFVNAIIRPILALLSCGCIVATLGLFILVINAFTLWFSSWIANQLNIGFNVDGFWPAFWGGIVVSVVSFLLSLLIPGDKES
jgi:putative membrane protein